MSPAEKSLYFRGTTYLRIGSAFFFALAQAAAANDWQSHLSRVWQEEFPLPSAQVRPLEENPPATTSPQLLSQTPHPAVARIVVDEGPAISYGSGTLIDRREQFGLVITNWHVVRDAQGPIEVVFPSGFTSKARAVKMDPDWDLAALVIWRPPVEPIPIAEQAPKPGDRLTICGYGPGNYRAATGRCTQYYAPRLNLPQQMVELDVQARQGDSGGPIFNQQGELAGVLFGAGQGTTLGSFGGRVDSFLASLAPDIGQFAGNVIAADETAAVDDPVAASASPPKSEAEKPGPRSVALQPPPERLSSPSDEALEKAPAQEIQLASRHLEDSTNSGFVSSETPSSPRPAQLDELAGNNLFEQVKTALAAIGLLAIVVQVLRVAR